MSRVSAAVAIVVGVVVLALCGCTQAIPFAPAPLTDRPAALAAEELSDIGNDRPQVTFDGLMVRRRVVVVVHSQEGADLAAIRLGLEKVANSQQLALSDISAAVLDGALLEHLVRPVIVSLPAGSTLQDAFTLTDPKRYPAGGLSGALHMHTVSVLVHDLKFSVQTSDPNTLAEVIAGEESWRTHWATMRRMPVPKCSRSATPGRCSATISSHRFAPPLAGTPAWRRMPSPSHLGRVPDPGWT
ncbi:hypothetical protein NHF46_11565 [Arthrobacter alpinus]|nr:hypothetical protein [Arthrobacter alpinus]